MIKVGDVFKTNKGGDCIVVDYINYDNIIVEFCDKHKYTTKVRGCELKRGSIKNPYAPLLFGIGYYGVGKHKSKEGPTSEGFASLPAYSAWTNMLSRCYDKNYRDRRLYENSYVDEDWHCFQTFADWYYDKTKIATWEGRKCLDKDILGDGKLYSETNCCIVPAAINRVIAVNYGGVYLPGVLRSTNGLYGVIPEYDNSRSRFKTEIEAHEFFVKTKVNKIQSLAEKYREQIDPIVFETLMTKDFRFKFSPILNLQF